jgi:DNA-binding MarR family transcriptional regulator
MGAAPGGGHHAVMSSSSKKQQGPAQGVLDSVVGHHLACARVTTHVTFLKHFGQPFDLRPVEYSLLMLLAANAQLTPKQLAQSLALSAPNLTILLDRMQERGLLQRVRSEVDRRSQHILLTDAGRTMADEISARTPAMEAELDGCLSRAERALLIELLGKIARHQPPTR